MKKEMISRRERSGKRIDDLMVLLVSDLIDQFGMGYSVFSGEIRQLMKDKYGVYPSMALYELEVD